MPHSEPSDRSSTVNDSLQSQRHDMALILRNLGETLTHLRENLEGIPDEDVAVWVDGDHMYVDMILAVMSEQSLDVSLQAGRLLVTATR
jgi:hypothetical protein